MRDGYGAALSYIQRPTQLILVGENAAAPGQSQHIDPEFWYDASFQQQGHLQTSNWLFADGHVKSMKPIATAAPIDMWNIDNNNAGTAMTSTTLLTCLTNSTKNIQ